MSASRPTSTALSERQGGSQSGNVKAAFNSRLGQEILNLIRDGETIHSITETLAKSGDPRAPDRLTIYKWLRNPKCIMSDGSTFAAAYVDACEDRRITWQDQAVEIVRENAQRAMTGKANGSIAIQSMKAATDLASQLRGAAKESVAQLQERKDSGGVTVVIRTFKDPVSKVDK